MNLGRRRQEPQPGSPARTGANLWPERAGRRKSAAAGRPAQLLLVVDVVILAAFTLFGVLAARRGEGMYTFLWGVVVGVKLMSVARDLDRWRRG